MAELGKADGNPTKAFFVRMITRDIALEDCILDLIDNSVDGAWALEGGMPAELSQGTRLSKYRIDIELNEKSFLITDNCGGIAFKDAEEYAFTFGRKDTEIFEDYSIGVYGIGMKRAIFKLGRKISVRSTHRESNKIVSFQVPIGVKEWLTRKNTKDWDFKILDDTPLEKPGVEIIVTSLNSDTATSFSNPVFERNLRRMIARDYTLHLHQGLKITLNKKPVVGWVVQMRESDAFAPVRLSYEDPSGVHVEIIAGMAAPPPETNSTEEAEGDDRFGWYVACNGRIVLAADKTAVSGWGTDGWQQWHGQYNGFIGLVMFTSPNAGALPLTTTKRSVDTSSAVYRRAQAKMREASRQWISYTNTRKQAIEEAKVAESNTKPASIYKLAAQIALKTPTLNPIPKERVANIAYSVPLKRARTLGEALGNRTMAYREIGRRTFEYTYKRMVGSL